MFINNLNFLNFPFLGRGGGGERPKIVSRDQVHIHVSGSWIRSKMGGGGGGMPGTFLDRLEELFLVVHNHLNQACMGNIASDK